MAAETAIIIPVPEAEAAVGQLRARYDRAAGLGAPPHITLLYPFLAPEAAAERAGLPLPTRAELVSALRSADAPERLTLIEGAGGLLVRLGDGSVTLRDLAADLPAPVLVVVAAGLGTLNHTELTLESLAGQGIPCAGLVIGAWPAHPGPAEEGNLKALARLAPLRAVLPAGAGTVSADEFEVISAGAFDREWIESL